jgi:hypothetical protein
MTLQNKWHTAQNTYENNNNFLYEVSEQWVLLHYNLVEIFSVSKQQKCLSLGFEPRVGKVNKGKVIPVKGHGGP